ncbi:MAG: flagellar filament capping protein FliD [Gammaproteobacteria bacterium]
MASIQSLGVGSGLLTSDLVEQIIDAERAPVEARLDNKQAIAEAKISAYGEITSALSSFDGVLQALKLPSTFNASTVSSTSESTVTGTASSLAVTGNYTVNVSQLAQAHSIASGSYEELTSTVGTGVMNFRFGTTTYGVGGSYDSFELNADAQAKTIVISAANNTLSGIRDAVNNANFGVQASIVDDGSGYRLVFSGKNSGAENSIEMTVSGTEGLEALNYNATSQNATLTATTATSTLDLSTGGGLDTNSLAFTLAYQGIAMDIAVPANGSIANTEDALSAVQTVLDAQLTSAGFSAGDVIAKADGDRLYFETAGAGFDQELQVITDGASAVVTGGSALTEGFDFSANNATFEIAIDNGVAQAITLNTATATRQETVDLVNTALTNAGLDSDVVASLSSDNKLVFTRISAGAASSIQISNVDSSGTGASAELGLVMADVDGLDGFGLDDSEGLVEGSVRLTETIAAQDALFTVNGLSISRSNNLVTGVVTGTTINLKGVTAGPVTLAVSKDASTISTKIQEFVDSYNGLKAIADELTAFDTTAGDNGQGSLLTGDSTLRLAISEINSILRKSVTGLTGSVRSLSEIGITTNQNNSYMLSFDSAKFSTKFTENSADVLSMFATSGKASDTLITYSSSSASTQPGTYDLEITRLATTGTYVGQSNPALDAGNIIIDANNDQFTSLLNGISADITLVQGTYNTAEDLAAHIQTRINSNIDYSNSNFRVAVTYNSSEQRFEMSSNTYGSSSNIGFVAVEEGMANVLGLTSPFQGGAFGNQLAGLSTPTGLSSENFDDAVVLNADTSFVLSINGISSSALTIPGSSGAPVTYNSPDELIAAISAQINSAPAFAATAAQTGVGNVLTAGQDFSATNLSVTLSLDNGSSETQVLIDGDANLVSFGGETPGTIENTLAAVQSAIDATALNGLVTAKLDESNKVYFETVATGASSQIQVTEDGAPGVDGLGIAGTNNLGEDALTVAVSYEYNSDSEFGRFVFSTDKESDFISMSSVSANAGNRLGLVTGFSPRESSVDGVDVAGTINGVEANGIGQTLIAGSGNIAALPGFYLNTAIGDLSTSSVADTFSLNVDGILSGPITLGTISNTDPIAVASSMQTAINNSPSILAAGVSVTVEYDTNTGGFGIISNSTGSSSKVLVNSLSGNAAGIFGFATGAGTTGRSGTNASGTADAASGIRLTVTGGDLGSRGTVSYIKGIAEDLSVLMDSFLDTGGLFSTRTSTLTTELASIADSRTALEERIARSEARLRTSFLANDIIISSLNSTADFLTSQLAALEALASGTNKS